MRRPQKILSRHIEFRQYNHFRAKLNVLLGCPESMIHNRLEMQLNRICYFILTLTIDKNKAPELIKNRALHDLLMCDRHLPDGLGVELIEQAYTLGGMRHAILLSGIDTIEELKRLTAMTHCSTQFHF